MAPKINKMLIPNVTQIPGKGKPTSANRLQDGKPSEFKGLLDGELNRSIEKAGKEQDLKLSIHAAKRLSERNLEIDSKEFMKLKGAIEKLKNKGGQDSLVITDRAAYIVDVKNNTIVTALDKENLGDNVFTKIDSTLFVN